MYVFRPQSLELTAVNEIILKDNINIFQMNGFDFEIQEDGKFFFLYLKFYFIPVTI